MIRIRKPQREHLQRLLRQQAKLTLTYPFPGETKWDEVPRGYNLVDDSFQLGQGQDCFEQATAALEFWTCFNLSWVQIVTDGPPCQDRMYALVVRSFGFWSVNCCRVLTWDPGVTNPRRWSLVIGTTPHHMASGEEHISVELTSGGDVVYRVRSFSRPGFWLSRMARGVMRRHQTRFCNNSRDAMMQYISAAQKTTAAS